MAAKTLTLTTGSGATTARAAAAALVIAAALAGCGSSNSGKADFKRGYPSINQELNRLGSDIGQTLGRARSYPATASEFRGFAARLRALKSRVDGLSPPGNLKATTAALSSAMSTLIGDLGAISAAAGVHDATAARTAMRALVQDSPALVAARRKLAQATGAAVGP
jgi:hypothetical protein